MSSLNVIHESQPQYQVSVAAPAQRLVGAAAGGAMALALPCALGLCAAALGGAAIESTGNLKAALTSPEKAPPGQGPSQHAGRLFLACAGCIGAVVGAALAVVLSPLLFVGGCIAGASPRAQILLDALARLVQELWQKRNELVGPVPNTATLPAQNA